MPLLEFKCLECEEIFDKLIFGDDRSNISCPHCNSKDLKQVYQGKSLFRQINSEPSSSSCPIQRSGGCPGCH